MQSQYTSLTQFLRHFLIEVIEQKRGEVPIISIIGSGGKTTLIETLALLGKSEHLKVLVTTTTHMALPEDHQYPFTTLIDDVEELTLPKEAILLLGTRDKGRIAPLPSHLFNQIAQSFDLILVEADGARGLPLKYHKKSEPVIPLQTTALVKILGLSSFRKERKEVIHNYSLFSQENTDRVDFSLIHTLAFHPQGLAVGSDVKREILFYNQSDMLTSKEIESLLEEGQPYLTHNQEGILIGSIQEDTINYYKECEV